MYIKLYYCYRLKGNTIHLLLYDYNIKKVPFLTNIIESGQKINSFALKFVNIQLVIKENNDFFSVVNIWLRGSESVLVIICR